MRDAETAFHKPEVNWAPQSEVICQSTPNWEIQCDSRASVQPKVMIECKGNSFRPPDKPVKDSKQVGKPLRRKRTYQVYMYVSKSLITNRNMGDR